MEYIIIENGKIKNHFISSSKNLPTGAVEVKNFYGNVGDPVEYYNKDWTKKSLVELVKEGLKEIPIGFKFNEDSSDFVEMSEIEKYKAGVIEIPLGYKIENDTLVKMTDEELLESGQITLAEYNEVKKQKIISELDYIDKKTTRPLRSILSGTGTDEDKLMLEDLENQANDLRSQLKQLSTNEDSN